MAKRTLEPAEVALIKGMLRRGLKNNEVQFHFNRNDRPVNSGRITEIKKGYKWAEIEAATDEELDAYLASKVDGTVPDQLPDASRFTTNVEGQIAVEPDPPIALPSTNPDQIEIYAELRGKTKSLTEVGDNMLGQLKEPVVSFLDVLPQDLSDASITRIWVRANKLRSVLRAHDEVKDAPDGGHPAEIDRACAESLRDVVQTYNVFILGDPKGFELDQKSSGPEDRADAVAQLELAQPLVKNIGDIATDEVSDVVSEQLKAAGNAPNTIDGDQIVGLARDTAANLFVAIVRRALSEAKAALGKEFLKLWDSYKSGVHDAVRKAGFVSASGVIVYIVSQSTQLATFAEAAIRNPVVSRIIEFISKVFG